MPYVGLPLHSPTETLLEIEFVWTGPPPCVPRSPLSPLNSCVFSRSSTPSQRSYRPTLTPGDYLVHAFGPAARDALEARLDLAAGKEGLVKEIAQDPSTAPERPRFRRSRKSKSDKYPKTPPKGTFTSAQPSEERKPSRCLSSELVAEEEQINTEKTKDGEEHTSTAIVCATLDSESSLSEEASLIDIEEEEVYSEPLSPKERRYRKNGGEENDMSREPPMSSERWRAKAEERLERRKLRRVKFAFEGTGPNLKSEPLPLDIDCRPMVGSFGLAPPVELPRVRREKSPATSIASTRSSSSERLNEQGEQDTEKDVYPTLSPKSLNDMEILTEGYGALHIGPIPD